jgi:hypothetical protein
LLKRIPAFVWGQVIGALITGVVTGAFIDWKAVWVFPAVLAGNALLTSLICWWWPGFAGAWWKLWLMATLVNPLMLAAIAWSFDNWECLVGGRTGWSCLLASAGLDVMVLCLPAPLIGLAARWWRKRAIA